MTDKRVERITHPEGIYLASSSPRRVELLEQWGVVFEQRGHDVDEDAVEAGAVEAGVYARMLAYLKTGSVARQVMKGLVIGCDTVVVCDGAIIGKPRDAADAEDILNRLVDWTHEVISGVAILDVGADEAVVVGDRATVMIHHPGEEQMKRYLESGEWEGKAGGYNLGELEHRWHIDVEGDPTTVIGLPMRKTMAALRRVVKMEREAE